MLFVILALLCSPSFANPLSGNDIWVAEIKADGRAAELIALQFGYKLVKKADFGTNLYVLKKDTFYGFLKRSYWKIQDHFKVPWIAQQKSLVRVKRGIFSWLDSRYRREFNDELWDKEWYMQDYRAYKGMPIVDLNTVPCYREGITGAGVRVNVVDDGLEKDHIDLKANFDPDISYDFNDDDPDPTPRYDKKGSNSHGTKCAGEIAMVANNKICGVGIAYHARIGGIRILDGNPSDLMEATALSYKLDKVDVFSNSWGPNDDGQAMEGPGRLLIAAFEKGVTQGRRGLGTIYIFAAGNGKYKGDNCGADGYVNAVYTIAVASASQEGKTVYYGENCPSILATAYSSGGIRNEQIATTNLNNTCTLRHTGTSAAAPLAAGIVALLLQANPNLTWRDVQHLIVWTSEVSPLFNNEGWIKNGFNFWVSHDFGFGLLNAYNLVNASRRFQTVPPKTICLVPIKLKDAIPLQEGSRVVVKFMTSSCSESDNAINYLEHVELEATIPYNKRGSVSVYLRSPSGTMSRLLNERPKDFVTIGLRRWKMASVQFWGEPPAGIWTVIVRTKANEVKNEFQKPKEGYVKRLSLILHGTKDAPEHYKNGPRQYAPFINRGASSSSG